MKEVNERARATDVSVVIESLLSTCAFSHYDRQGGAVTRASRFNLSNT